MDFKLKQGLSTRAASLGLLKKLNGYGYQHDDPFVNRIPLPDNFWTDDRIAKLWFMGKLKEKRRAARDVSARPRAPRQTAPAQVVDGQVVVKKRFAADLKAMGRDYARDVGDQITSDDSGGECEALDIADGLIQTELDGETLARSDREMLRECLAGYILEGIKSVMAAKAA